VVRRDLRRTALALGAALLFLALAGMTYQGTATAFERRRLPRPGGMVEVYDHQLHIHCLGSGLPTVVLEAPAAGMSAAWGWVQPQVAQFTRVCSYDRAGLGWSESAGDRFDPAAVPTELSLLLANANEKAPFVLVGQGLGAAFAKLFAAHHGEETSALILIDAPEYEDQAATLTSPTRISALTPWLARVGVWRAMGMSSRLTRGLPPPFDDRLGAFLNRPDHLTRAADELSRWNEIVALADEARVKGTIPVVHLDIDGPEPLAFLTHESAANPILAAIRDVTGRQTRP